MQKAHSKATVTHKSILKGANARYSALERWLDEGKEGQWNVYCRRSTNLDHNSRKCQFDQDSYPGKATGPESKPETDNLRVLAENILVALYSSSSEDEQSAEHMQVES